METDLVTEINNSTYYFFVGLKNGQVFDFKNNLDYLDYEAPLKKINNKTFVDSNGKTFRDERINYEWCYLI
jgi:hypothetical protein